MSWPAILIYAVVAFVGLPAAFRNPTAAALVLAWLVAECVWLLTGDNLPISTYFMADVAVITMIYAKTIRRVGVKNYPTIRMQLKCLILDLTNCDRWVVGLFLLGAWPAYILSADPYYKWWWLYAVTITQFILAGAEAIQSFRHNVNERAAYDPPGLALAGYWAHD